ncbi:MAG: hypothetical protein J6U26_05370 [Lachnospiraceae bacterium]|nr:hypothetical protein [Lachnospiraceae bacterium]
MQKIVISDYTFRKLNEERERPLLFREIISVARSLDRMNLDRIELPRIRHTKEEAVILKTLAETVENAALCQPISDTAESAEAAWDCIKGARKPVLQVNLPVSTVCMEYEYHVKSPVMTGMISTLVAAAKAYTEEVEFIARDASRAEEAYLLEAVKAAEEAGATVVTLTDPAGVWMTDECADAVRKVTAAVRVPVYVEVSNAISMGTANAAAALRAGAAGIKTSVVGKNVLKTGRFIDMIAEKGEALGVETGIRMTELHRNIDDVLGRIRKNSDISRETSRDAEENTDAILLTPSSSLSETSDACRALGYDLTAEDLGNVFRALQNVLLKKKEIGAKELDAIIASASMQVPSTYHLEQFVYTSGNVTTAMSHVVLRSGETYYDGVATGDGPIDAAFKAIEQSVGYHYELDDFQIQAVTSGGADVLGSALVRLRNAGKLFSGNAVSADIVSASIRAYVNALNKIVYEEGGR